MSINLNIRENVILFFSVQFQKGKSYGIMIRRTTPFSIRNKIVSFLIFRDSGVWIIVTWNKINRMTKYGHLEVQQLITN